MLVCLFLLYSSKITTPSSVTSTDGLLVWVLASRGSCLMFYMVRGVMVECTGTVATGVEPCVEISHWGLITSSSPMIGENRQIVTNEPVEFEK